MGVLEYLILILQLAQTIDEYQHALGGAIDRTSREGSPYNTENHAIDIHLALLDEAFGLAALSAQIAAVRYDDSANPAPDLQVIFDTLNASPLVTLPEVPPPGYGPDVENGTWAVVFGTYTWCVED